MQRLKKVIFSLAIICFVFGALTALTAKVNSPIHGSKIDYRKSSENKPYPDVKKYPHMWIHVNLKKQRVYLMNDNDKLYTMYCSSGANNATPTGTYHIEDLRGDKFYSESEKAGGRYYVAWKGSDFLFHSVPIDGQGHYIKSQAKYLGKKPMSHGCIRLSVPDAKWMSSNIPTGTEVKITKD